MKKKKKLLISMFALITIVCLQYMHYYETELYYRKIFFIYDFVYGYIAGPLFFYFFACVATELIISFKQVAASRKMKKYLKVIDCLAWIGYVTLIIIKIANPLNLPFIIFQDYYKYVFILGGIILAFTIDMKKEGGKE